MGKDIFPLETTSSCRKVAWLPDEMRVIQLESLLVKAVIISLALIVFIAVPWMEALSRWGGWIYLGKVAYARDVMNSFSRCYANATTSVSQKLLNCFAQLTNTNKHSTTG